MPPKPALEVSEPSAGYAESAVRPVKPAAVPLSTGQQAYLDEALADLADLDEHAAELDMPPPDPSAKKAARAFLPKAVREAPRDYAVSPWGDGSVIVFAQGKKGFRVSVYFETDGSAVCHIIRPRFEQSEKRHFSPAEEVACEWVFEAFRNVDPAC